MAPKTQKALLVTKMGKPVTLVEDRAVPEPGTSQVLVHVTVAGANPHDQKCRDRGLFIANNLPAVLTNDVVGEVVTLGQDVTKYAVGDHIVGQAQSGLQEYTVFDVDHSMKIPEGFTADDVATLPINLITGVVALFHEGTLAIPAPWTDAAKSFDYKGTTLLIIGGGSNCGKFGVQLAKLAGIGRIVVVGGDDAEMKSYGATDIIDRHGSPDETTKRIRNIVGDDLLYAYDTINPPETQHIAINALSSTKKGKFARLLPSGPVDESAVHDKKAGYELKNVSGNSSAKADLCKPFWELLPQYLVEKKIKPAKYVVVKGLDADKVNAVLDAYRDGKKVVKTNFHLLE